MATEQETNVVPLELGEADITPLVSADAGDVVAPSVFVHILFAFRTLLGRLLDHILGRLFVFEAFLVSTVVLVARLALVPGDVVPYAVRTLALFAFEFRAGLVIDLARCTGRGETPPEVGHVLERCAGG